MTAKNEQFKKLVEDLQRQVNESFAPGERLPSRRDLAAMYGVGATTIDRALQSLNTKGVVRPATRVGWFRAPTGPDKSQSVRAAKALRVGILSRYTRPEWDTIYVALSEEARRRGVLVVEVPNPHRERPTAGRSRIQLSRVPWNEFDVGLLVDAEDTIAHDAQALRKRKVLCVDYDGTRLGLDSVAFDDNEVGAIVARYLCGLGHQRFAVTEDLNDPGLASDPNTTARRLGFEWTVSQLGGIIMPEWRLMLQRRCWRTPRVDFVASAVARWAAAPVSQRPTAVFVTTGAMQPLLSSLARHKLRVPADISIATASLDEYEQIANGMRITRVSLKISSLVNRVFDFAAELAAETVYPGAATRPPKLMFASSLLIPGQSTASRRA